MTRTCQLPALARSMFAKTSLILTLIVSLLFVTQAQPMSVPAEMKKGGVCAGMQCAPGCCSNMACCAVAKQQQAPLTPAPAPQQTEIQLATIGLQVFTLLFTLPTPERTLVIFDETHTAHTLSPLAASCICLI